MRKIIIILIITLTTFMGGNIYTNNEKRLSENVTKNSEDNTIIFEENTIISESFDDNFQKIFENSEMEKELNISNDKESEEIAPEESNVTVTLCNTTEKKRKEKITKEEKKIEETQEKIIDEEKKETQQPKEEPKVVETKSEPIKESEPVIPKCDGSNHGVGVGNSNKWFNSKQEAINYYDGIQKTWGDKWERFEIDSATYDKNCPYGYEVWTCPFCGKWTINFYYR